MRIDLGEIRAHIRARQRIRAERRAALRDVGVALLDPPLRPRRFRAIAARVLSWKKSA